MNPLYIIESGLDDMDDGDVYDDNFSGMYDLDDTVNQSIDGVYKLELKFNITAIPSKFKSTIETLAEYLRPLDEYLCRYFVRKTTILQTFDRIRYMLHPSTKTATSPTVINNIIFINTPDVLKNASIVQHMKTVQVKIPCNFRKNGRAINKLIMFTFRTLQEFVHKNMNHGVKYPTISDVGLYNPETEEGAWMSHLTFKNNSATSIKASLRKFHKIVLGETDKEAYEKYFESKTDMDFVNALLLKMFAKQAISKAEITNKDDMYLVKINARSIQAPSSYVQKHYDNICNYLGKPIIFDVSETLVNVWVSYSHTWESLQKFLAITTKEVKCVYADVHTYNCQRDDIKFGTLNLQGCHIKQMTIEAGEKFQKKFRTTNGTIDNVEFKLTYK